MGGRPKDALLRLWDQSAWLRYPEPIRANTRSAASTPRY